MNVHSVYKLCTVSTNYAQCLQTILGQMCMCTVSTNHAQCLQTIHSVHTLHVCAYTSRIHHIYVYAYTYACTHTYAYMYISAFLTQSWWLVASRLVPPPPVAAHLSGIHVLRFLYRLSCSRTRAYASHVANPLGMKYFCTLTIPRTFLIVGCKSQGAVLSEGQKVARAKKEVLRHLVQPTPWKTEGVRRLEKG